MTQLQTTKETTKERVSTVRDLLERSKSQIALALPRHMSADRLLRVAMTSVQRNPRLLECDPISLVGAVIQSAQLGLEPDGVLGHAYLVPYRNRKKGTVEVQFQPGYKGLLALARRSGDITSVEARVVYEKDHFEYAFGLNPDLVHIPSRDDEPGEIAFVYAIVRLKDGSQQWDVMSRAQVEGHRRRYAREADDSPWNKAWDEMAKKTVLRRVLKFAPASVELQQAVALDEHADVGLPQDLGATVTTDATAVVEQPKSKLDALAETLQERRGNGASEETQTPPAATDQEEPPVATEPVSPAEADLFAGPPNATDKRAMIQAIADQEARWEKAPSAAVRSAIFTELVGTDDLTRVDVAALDDVRVLFQGVADGDNEARRKVNAIAKKVKGQPA
jgi:recombination protein RecT